ncbi:unnamed protein product [Acanthoscelides obtectus]|uniref:Uncharacterized protein n=1 Tax=Acanthoscelides obtectus TaxID=200917 RepID=A0A9P0MM31_ACAOB|nr:unnamed protein product [Acanthoscelides obtectus]CAK1659864.1 hypothetical protein AOBTE_LOCUS21717 [Acanthoscelides obtectus]
MAKVNNLITEIVLANLIFVCIMPQILTVSVLKSPATIGKFPGVIAGIT